MKLLIVDDEESLNFALSELFKEEGYSVTSVYSAEEALVKFEGEKFDIALFDYNLPGINGLDLLTVVKKNYPLTQVIIMTAYGSESVAIDAIKKGAYDYISKPFENIMIRNRVNNIRESFIKNRKSEDSEFGYYYSPVMKAILDKIKAVTKTDIPILITGESGTGKELIAKLCHFHSGRKGKFISVNCSALPEGLIESELFGAEKGSFTGSTAQKIGLFEQADNGTIFLDEIGEMPIALQAKLLRVIQENEIMRLGSGKIIKINARVLAATNIDIEEKIKNNQFREDLYYRLNVVHLKLPPLRERKDEIKPLIMSFLNDFNAKYNKSVKGFEEPLLEEMVYYPWKGNIRELKNKIEHAVIMCSKDFAGYDCMELEDTDDEAYENNDIIEHEPYSDDNIFDFSSLPEIYCDAKKQLSELFERKFILYHLNRNDWNVRLTAEKVGLSRQDLYKKMKKVGLKKSIEYF